jgi:lysylphosphatidylglycerol synthetase-like protein (DUF2156 family)
MIKRAPPAIATWLLKQLGPRYHGESLAGDLIEQYGRGRGAFWYWRQTAIAIVLARLQALRAALVLSASRALLRVVAEIVVVVGVASWLSAPRHSISVQQLLTPGFIAALIAVVAIAVVGFRGDNQANEPRRKRLFVNHLIAVFAVITLGIGTLTWASTTSNAPCKADSCVCAKTP